jgi:small-conductance mechanosensitive channel
MPEPGWIKTAHDFFAGYPQAFNVIKAVLGLVVLYVAYVVVLGYARRIVRNRVSQQTSDIVKNALHFTFIALAVMYVFRLFGININAVLGAAGIAGVAVGFAAQTSVSNIISGFFLLGEKTVKAGDFIAIGDTSGTVDSINFLSIKLKTADNQMVRVPNETIIKSNLVNYSAYPIRRYSLSVQVSYRVDLSQALAVLREVPALCGGVILTDPAPSVYVNSFDDSGITIVLNAWFNNSDLYAAKSALFVNTKALFDSRGIDIPFPQVEARLLKD